MYGQWTHLQLNSFSLFDVCCCCKNTNCKSHRPNSISHVFCNSWRFCTFMFPLLRVLSAFLCRRTAVHYLQAPASLSRRNRQKTARLWIHRPQLARWRSSPFSRISNPKASFWLNKGRCRPSHTWLRAIEADLKPLNIGLSSAWKKATSRETWRSVVDMATLKKSMPWEEEYKGTV